MDCLSAKQIRGKEIGGGPVRITGQVHETLAAEW
jgi:hypothetical protein